MSSIGNLSQPASDEQPLRDEVYNVPAPDLVENGKDSVPLEYVTGSRSPQIQTAQRVYLTPLSRITGGDNWEMDHARSRSMDIRSPVQLETIEEIPQRARSLRRTGHSQLQGPIKIVNPSPFVKQKPRESSLDPPESTPHSFEIPGNNTTGATQYPVPLPPSALRERLNDRPSPDQLLQERRNSSTSNGTLRGADNSRSSREIWRTPRSDKISNWGFSNDTTLVDSDHAISNDTTLVGSDPLASGFFDSDSSGLRESPELPRESLSESMSEPISEQQTHPGSSQLEEPISEEQTHSESSQLEGPTSEEQTHPDSSGLGDQISEEQNHPGLSSPEEPIREEQPHPESSRLEEPVGEEQNYLASGRSREPISQEQAHPDTQTHNEEIPRRGGWRGA